MNTSFWPKFYCQCCNLRYKSLLSMLLFDIKKFVVMLLFDGYYVFFFFHENLQILSHLTFQFSNMFITFFFFFFLVFFLYGMFEAPCTNFFLLVIGNAAFKPADSRINHGVGLLQFIGYGDWLKVSILKALFRLYPNLVWPSPLFTGYLSLLNYFWDWSQLKLTLSNCLPDVTTA